MHTDEETTHLLVQDMKSVERGEWKNLWNGLLIFSAAL
jgi:hypothetical protein